MAVNTTSVFNWTNLTTSAPLAPLIPTTGPRTFGPPIYPERDGGIVLLIVACLCSGLWLIYMTFYHSRLLGYILTEFINFKYMKEGHYFQIGSFSFSILSGKIMFRDVKYITKDLSFRVVDGYAIFKYWLPYKQEESKKPYPLDQTSHGQENSEQRLNIWLSCVEYHVYSRSGLYTKLEDLFRYDKYGDAAKSNQNIHAVNVTDPINVEIGKEAQEPEGRSSLPSWVLDLVPAVRFDINVGKIAFGNRLFETTLGIQFESAVGIYTTTQPNSSVDQFMHLVKCNGRNVRVMLFPSPGYNGPRDEPPRFMGDGFVVVQSGDCRITYYMDEPGVVPESKGEGNLTEIPDSDPSWGIDIVFVKSTSICYGPWVDRQREALQRFFYPLDYQEMAVTKPLVPGQLRIHTGLDIKFDFENEASLDILFSKNQETRAVHVCVGAGSHIGVYQPWTVNDYGYTTSVVTKLLNVDASTSMSFRNLFEADTLDLAFHMSFPRVWNQTQHWACDVNVHKVTWYFVFTHKWYFQELLEDWSVNYRPDLLTFVPYEWQFNIVLHDFEMIWIANEHNWIECSSNPRQENAELAFCGEVFDLTFVLQFLRFLPEFEDIKFFLQVEKLVARACLPEYDTLRRSFLSLSRTSNKRGPQAAGMRSRSSTTTALPEEGIDSGDETTTGMGGGDGMFTNIFRRYTDVSRGWVDVMSVPIMGLSLGYMYHPVIPNSKYDVPRDRPLLWEPLDMEPDVITLELEAGPAALRLFGSLLRILNGIKENYFGMDQVFQECVSLINAKGAGEGLRTRVTTPEPVRETINMFSLRPLEANLYISLYDFKTELTKHCGPNEPSSPLLIMERLTFEMHKTYKETRLQVHLTPMTILVSDNNERGLMHQHLSKGHLSLSGFQMRGHAMFSDKGLPPDSETLEYAWLVELQFGILSGKITIPQIQSLVNWGQTFVFHLLNEENSFEPSRPYQRCIHGNYQNLCTVNAKPTTENKEEAPCSAAVEKKVFKRSGSWSKGNKGTESKGAGKGKGRKRSVVEDDPGEAVKSSDELCITEDDIKYRMTRVSLENVDVYIVETGVACNLEISPLRLATCNLHSAVPSSGLSAFLQAVKIRQFVLAPFPLSEDPMLSDVHKRMSVCDDVIWLEAASMELGPIISDVALATDNLDNRFSQKDFLQHHDHASQRLWFLWEPSERHPNRRHGCCACVGGCNFFGKNVNGPRFFVAEKLDASYNDTGIGGFGSEGGFYDDANLGDQGSKALMYSRDALGSSYMDASPMGSVEAFTRKRYHGSESSGSPKLRPAHARYRHDTEATTNMDIDEDGSGGGATSRLSWSSSLQKVSSSITNMHQRMRNARGNLQGSRQGLNRSQSIQSGRPPLPSASSQRSVASDGSFYSCGSLLDETNNSEGYPLYRAASAESFISAVEFPGDLMQFEDEATYMSRFLVSCPHLVHRYSQHLSQLECLNWSMPQTIAPDKRIFSLVQNLKATDSDENFTPPGVPQFNYRNARRLELPLLVKRYHRNQRDPKSPDDDADVSSTSSGSVYVSHDTVLDMATHEKKGNASGSNEVIDQSEQDSVRKARWKSAMNEGDVMSASSTDTSPVGTLTKRASLSRQNMVVLRFDGEVNMLVSPLLLDALQRYISSVTRQDRMLHPATVIDLVHGKCTDAAEHMYRRRLADPSNSVVPSEAPKEDPSKQTVLYMSTSKINVCFLQAAIPEIEAHKDKNNFPGTPTGEPVPSISLLAGCISGITSEVLTEQKAAAEETEESGERKDCKGCKERRESAEKNEKKDKKEKMSCVVEIEPPKNEQPSKKVIHRNTSTIGSIKCSHVQFQLRKLCDHAELENSVTTAIPEPAAKAKFNVNGEHLKGYVDETSGEELPSGTCLSLLMLECGMDNISIQGGSECGNGQEIMPKIRRRRRSVHRDAERKAQATDEDVTSGEGGGMFHGFSNPIFQRENPSLDIEAALPADQRKSVESGLSSLTSSTLSFLSSSSGNMSDIESDGSYRDEEATVPLLKTKSRKDPSKVAPGEIPYEGLPNKPKDAELARRVDITINVSSIWFNLACPTPLKTIPANYHLYNNLVTTLVPFTMAWLPRVLEVKEQVRTLADNRSRHLMSVVACLMSQALPDHGRIPKKHGVHYLSTKKARFLQEDHSSQLIYVLRRQLIGSRLIKVRTALAVKEGIPANDKLSKGIFALARQWKCFLAGTEKGEILFYGSHSIKRRVVGRGVLTERDRAILMKEEHGRETLDTIHEDANVQAKADVVEPVQAVKPSQANDKEDDDACEPPRSPRAFTLPITPVHLEPSPSTSRQRTPLLRQADRTADSDSDESDEDNTLPRNKRSATFHGGQGFRPGHKKQLSLYSWLSNTPTPTSGAGKQQASTCGTATENKAAAARMPQINAAVSPDKSEQSTDLFAGDMVSVPTSGKQIQDERETFKTVLQAIGLMPKVAKDEDTASTVAFSTKLKYVRMDLVSGGFDNLTKSKGKGEGKTSAADEDKPSISKQLFSDADPVFLAKEFCFKLVRDRLPHGESGDDLTSSKATSVKFNVSCGTITQRVNLSFVRLTIQMADMVELLLSYSESKVAMDSTDGPVPEFAQLFVPGSSPRQQPSVPMVKCWKIMYQVLDLYSSLPREAKNKGFMKRGGFAERISPEKPCDVRIDIEDGPRRRPSGPASQSTRQSDISHRDWHELTLPDYTLSGVVTLPRTRLLAMIGGLVLETEIKDVNSSVTRRGEMDGPSFGQCTGSVSAHLGSISVSLLEKVQRQTRTVITCHLNRSHALYTSSHDRDQEKNLALLTLGLIEIDIPQHPVALHTMMTRSSRAISRHISDIQTQRSVIRSMGSWDASSTRISRRISGVPAEFVKQHFASPTGFKAFSPMDSVDGNDASMPRVTFNVVLKGFTLGASLLPSLKAGYRIGRVSANGCTGKNSLFKVSMPTHSLMFSSKVQSVESNIPSSTEVELPPVTVSGDFTSRPSRPARGEAKPNANRDWIRVYYTGTKGRLNAAAEVGAFQHSLTTDLLNHLVFVQKSFMKEVNEVLQRVSGESQPVPLWRSASVDSIDSTKEKEVPILYSFKLTLKGIQVTATTPSSTAVRLDTGVMALEVSNAIPSPPEPGQLRQSYSFIKLFGKAQVDVNLSLGEFTKIPVDDTDNRCLSQSRIIDDELEFVQMAYFRTNIGVRNSFQDVSSTRGTEDKETFLVTLTQPKIYAQQIAFDKAVLVYLNYKNAYEHWNEQRMALNEEYLSSINSTETCSCNDVHTATQAVLEKLPARTHAAQLSGSLFLQLNIDMLGICIPLYNAKDGAAQAFQMRCTDPEPSAAMVLSVDEMMLSCCSSASFVSKGKFNRFCLWFPDKFDKQASDWRPSSDGIIMNSYVVSQGTYELCSRTIRYPLSQDMAKTGKWVMSVRWQMCGVEIHCDTDIGKRLSSLANTMTSLAGDTDIANMESVAEATEKDASHATVKGLDEVDSLAKTEKHSSRRVEKDMWEQARKVNELKRQVNVKGWLLEKETKLLQELESAVFNEFRKDVRKKLRRHSRGQSGYANRGETGKKSHDPRRAMSEQVKGSRSRSRLHGRISGDATDAELEGSEMVDLSHSRKRLNRKLNTTDSYMPQQAYDEADASMESSLTRPTDALNSTPGPHLAFTEDDETVPTYRSTPYNKDQTAPVVPRVTFNTADVQDQSSESPRPAALPQQNLDFELDVTVDIEGGKCVLHTCDTADKDEATETKPSAKRVLSADPTRPKVFSPMYPTSTSTSGRRYKSSATDVTYQLKDTVLLLPGVDVRMQYSSSFDSEGPTTSPSSPAWTTTSTLCADGSMASTLVGSEARTFDSSQEPASSAGAVRKMVKSAGLYIWVSLQSLPQEMVLKPSIIDFVEQAMEPIIVPDTDEGVDGATLSDDGTDDDEAGAAGSMVSSSMSEYSSFPVDVVVVVRVQPSDIRFSCQPVSKVECMLRLPALDVVFSSKSSPNKYLLQAPTTRTPTRDTSPRGLSREGKQPSEGSDSSAPTFDSGGISFTVCLSSFSFSIFHPYGKQHTGVSRASSSPLDGDADASEDSRARFRFTPTQPMSGKKDSLSLDVEFVKFNLSRRRVASAVGGEERGSRGGSPDLLSGVSSSTVVKVSGICDIGSAAFNYDMRRLNEILDFPKAWYKRSLMSRLFLGKEGSYAAKSQAMDMPDPPASTAATGGRVEMEHKRSSSPVMMLDFERTKAKPSRPILSRSMSEEDRRKTTTPTRAKSTQRKTPSSGGGFFSFLPSSPSLFRSMTMSGTNYGLLTPGHASPPTPRRQTMTGPRKRPEKPLHSVVEQSSASDTEVDGPLSHSSSSSAGSRSKWETVIIVALNLSRLDVSTNMGSIMGQTVWSTSDIRAQSHLTLTNTGRRQLRAKVKIRQAICESRSGIVGGHIEVNELVSKANVTEERGSPPEHVVSLCMRYAEARVDYMGTCILMGNMSAFRIDLQDEWTLHDANSPSTDVLFEGERDEPVKAKIFMHGDLCWTDFKLMISRSTTPDLVKMTAKIQDFFTQQHRNSIRALSTLRPPTQYNTMNILSSLTEPVAPSATHPKDKDFDKNGLKYQHWSKVLNAVCGLKLSMLGNPLPERGVVLGGSLALRGKGVSLACFHGVNFRAQSWVLFSLSSPYMEFVSKVCSEEKSCQVRRVRSVQQLMIRLGNGDEDQAGTHSPTATTATNMAVVRKVARGRRNPPSMGSSVQEWLGYVCATGDDDFLPSDEEPARQRSDSPGGSKKTTSTPTRGRSASYRYEHDSETIFALPKFEVNVKTEHDLPMSAHAPSWVKRKTSVPRVLTTPSPHVVECSFSSCFNDSLCVTMDVGLLFFLHDVVQTYIKENETTTSGSLPRGMSPTTHARNIPPSSAGPSEERDKTPKAVDQQKRVRQFRSKAWKLEPKVRFLSWAGKNMDPVNMDWVLQKLGFTHARLTIPKWAQRGAMDPMDIFLSVLIERLLAGMKESSAYLDDEP
ncbi:transmembrane protein KIAA1109 homolog isoform X3 [Nematostella vectensis]|uniref:transmembrane protein KIAA1109 homolog isoform X3 n=1 Tax=Nematostella vectensis TaxID=45351 RepID=UPI002076E7DE|nr:transmembrane protein KIAA1109 homolog isoform X3 [Nematostella vectensis]